MKIKCIIIAMVLCLVSYSGMGQRSWVHVSTPGTNLFISSISTGYKYKNETVGSHGGKYTLSKSTDYMGSFSVIKTKTGDFGCYFMDNQFYVSDDSGVMVETCQGLISFFSTNNGGQSWNDMDAGGTYGSSMYFLSFDLGYYTFSPGNHDESYFMIYENGAPFTKLITTDYILHNSDNYRTAMHFVNDSTGFIICKNIMENAFILKVENYGDLVQQVYFLPMKTEFRDIIFSDENTGFVVGTNGIILKTEDQGDNWHNVATLPVGDLNSIDISESVIHIAGDNGQYIISEDMGDTWNSYPLIATTEDLIYTRFFNGYSGFILNASGELYTNFPPPGITEVQHVGSFNVYPSPAEDILNIDPEQDIRDYRVFIIDLTGKTVLQEEGKNTIDISSLKEGIYFTRIDYNGKSAVQKFIKR